MSFSSVNGTQTTNFNMPMEIELKDMSKNKSTKVRDQVGALDASFAGFRIRFNSSRS